MVGESAVPGVSRGHRLNPSQHRIDAKARHAAIGEIEGEPVVVERGGSLNQSVQTHGEVEGVVGVVVVEAVGIEEGGLRLRPTCLVSEHVTEAEMQMGGIRSVAQHVLDLGFAREWIDIVMQ